MTHGEVRTSHIFAMSQVIMEEGQESRGGLVMTRRGSRLNDVPQDNRLILQYKLMQDWEYRVWFTINMEGRSLSMYTDKGGGMK